jgi:RNA polymerase sigma-70 factor, ECF subfamily
MSTSSQPTVDPCRELTAAQLFPLVYDELRALAARRLEQERPGHTLQPTALIHEAYLKLAGQDRARWESTEHFLAVAADAVRRILVDHARARETLKRGRDARRIPLEDAPCEVRAWWEDLTDVSKAIERLSALHGREGRVAALRLFGGMTNEQIAAVLGVSRATVSGDWTAARAWLTREVRREGTP